jgi:diacylglycerol kinase (ATP)
MDAHKADRTRGLRHLWNATCNTGRGFAAAFRNEVAFRQLLLASIVLAPIGVWLGADGVERALLVAALMLTLIAELLNSSIEAVVDRIGTERHPLSGLAKDIASTAVGLAILNAIIVWILVLWPHYGDRVTPMLTGG